MDNFLSCLKISYNGSVFIALKKNESAKSHAWHALRVYVLAGSRAWRAYVLVCLRAWRVYVLGVLTCLHAYVLGVLACVRACLS